MQRCLSASEQSCRCLLLLYLQSCSRVIALGCSDPPVCRLPWVEGWASQRMWREVLTPAPNSILVFVWAKTVAYIGGRSKGRPVKSKLFQTGLGWLRFRFCCWRPKVRKCFSFFFQKTNIGRRKMVLFSLFNVLKLEKILLDQILIYLSQMHGMHSVGSRSGRRAQVEAKYAPDIVVMPGWLWVLRWI